DRPATQRSISILGHHAAASAVAMPARPKPVQRREDLEVLRSTSGLFGAGHVIEIRDAELDALYASPVLVGAPGRSEGPTMASRASKATRRTVAGRAQFEASSQITLHEYALEWVDRYTGRGRRGFREATRAEYRRVLEQYVLEHFPARTKLTEVTPRSVAGFV